MKNFLLQHTTLLAIIFILLIASISHGLNMFNYPYYENDEGTYLSQAWSLLTKQQLAPYTYWYDHAPLGWIMLSIWAKITGGFFTFGASVNSGRVFMLLIHLASSLLLYAITVRISRNKAAGVMAALLFSLTPLGIYFQRRVLLDNMMIFWSLLSLWLATNKPIRVKDAVLSGIAFGCAVLTKENAIFFFPALLYALKSNTVKINRVFSYTLWIITSSLLISLYFLYAFLKSELLPGSFFGNDDMHVSLIATLVEQLGRGENYPFWSQKSDFFKRIVEWYAKDPLFMSLGIVATIVGIIIAIKDTSYRLPILMTVMFWVFLMRGKLVLDFYIIPLIPLLSMTIALVVHKMISIILGKSKLLFRTLSLAMIFVPGLLLLGNTDIFTHNETHAQIKTIEWIRNNLPENSRIVIDNSLFIDLHDRNNPSLKAFHNADWAWKIEKDPAVAKSKIANDWKNIQYIALSHEMLKQIRFYEFPIIKSALDNSVPIVDYSHSSTSYRNITKYESTNGDWMSIYKVKDRSDIALESSWKTYKQRYIKSYGQVLDPLKNETTSRDQARALLTAVIVGDKDTFVGLLAWTKDHFQHRTDDLLFSRRWGILQGREQVIDSESDTTADQEIALSLILAYKKWGDETYLVSAKKIISDIWRKEVINIQGKYYLLSGTDGNSRGNYILLSTISPATYRMFAEVDQEHDWERVSEDAYDVLTSLVTTPNGISETARLSSGEVVQLNTKSVQSLNELLFHLQLDVHLFNSQRAKALITNSSSHFANSSSLTSILKVTTNDNTLLDKRLNHYLEGEFDYQNNEWKSSVSLDEYHILLLTLALFSNRV